MLILIDHIERGRHLQEVMFLFLVLQEPRIDEQQHMISLLQPLSDLTALAVHLDLLAAHRLIQIASGQGGKRLHQKTVDPLPGVIFRNDDFLHVLTGFSIT